MNRPELLAPAGGIEQLRYALHYGADAVYMAGNKYGLRVRADNFGQDHLREAVALAHDAGKKVFITCNAIMHQDDIKGLPAYLEYLNEIGADAVIANDLATIRLAKKHAPQLAIHASTQCSITNAQAAEVYHDMGAKRVVLARELSFAEIAEIRSQIPDSLELEIFCHGSMCMAYSGRCVISNALADRDANRGHCAQPCRWNYALVEEKRPGMYIPVEEDARGSYIMNSEDLNMLAYVPELMDLGVHCLKVEGRVKSAYYVGTVINAYRSVIDGAAPQEFAPELECVSHRPYSTGFYFDKARQATDVNGYVVTHRWAALPLSCTELELSAEEKPAKLDVFTFEAYPELISQLKADESFTGKLYYHRVSQKNRFYNNDAMELVKKSRVGTRLPVYGLMEHRGSVPKAVECANITNVVYSFYSTKAAAEFDLMRMRDKELIED